jgi:hypothetical protein
MRAARSTACGPKADTTIGGGSVGGSKSRALRTSSVGGCSSLDSV